MGSESPHSKDASLEVEVTLTPLDVSSNSSNSSSTSDIRTFHLNKENRKVDVGRASRNPTRNFQPASDNAAFRCPIMSRQHAQFTASPIHKVLYVEDLGSTHGTFLSDAKLSSGVKHVLKSGDIIRFGTTVANGSAVFSGKKIRVEYKWKPRYSNEAPANASRVFRVPDSDNEDEELAVISREPSVEVVESKKHNITYSVPSESEAESVSDNSENDCEELVSAPRTPQSKDKESPITSPEELDPQPGVHVVIDYENSGKTTKSRVRASPSKDSNEGSSQYNPIQLDEKNTSKEEVKHPMNSCSPNSEDTVQKTARKTVPKYSYCDETESEAEEPEVLKIHFTKPNPSVQRVDTSDVLKEIRDKAAARSAANNASESNADPPRSESTSPSREQTERIIRAMQNRVARDLKSKSSDSGACLPPVANFTTVSGSEDDQMHESEDEEENDHDEVEEYAEEDDDKDEEEADEQEENDGEDEEEVPHDEVLEEEAANGEVDYDKDDNQDLDEDFPIDFDEAEGFEEAALSVQHAESKSKVEFTYPYPEMVDVEATPVRHRHSTLRTPSPSDAAMAKDSHAVRTELRRNDLTSSNVSEAGSNSHTKESLNCIWPYAGPDTGERYWKAVGPPPLPHHHYTTGPFAMHSATNVATSPAPVQPPVNYSRSYGELEGFGNFAKKPRMSVAFALNEMDKARAAKMRKTETALKAAEDQSSKLQISNLVNSQHSEPVRSTKRKAAEISADTEDNDLDTAYSEGPTVSQDAQLPDAQPREQPIVTETSISLGEIVEPSVSSITTTIATETSRAEGPARKKAKTSSTGSGVGKFLLGVGVGAVGLAAAFLATIPASVQEEVRLGL